MASPSTKRQKTHKHKAPAHDAPILPTAPTGIEDVLDYSWYFSLKRQMVLYEKRFHGKLVL